MKVQRRLDMQRFVPTGRSKPVACRKALSPSSPALKAFETAKASLAAGRAAPANALAGAAAARRSFSGRVGAAFRAVARDLKQEARLVWNARLALGLSATLLCNSFGTPAYGQERHVAPVAATNLVATASAQSWTMAKGGTRLVLLTQASKAARVATVVEVAPEPAPAPPLSLTGKLVMVKGQDWTAERPSEPDRWYVVSPQAHLTPKDLSDIKAEGVKNGALAAQKLLIEKSCGKLLELNSSPKTSGPNYTSVSWLIGLESSDEITVRGALQPGGDLLDKDGKKTGEAPPTFLVEDYAPGAMNRFVYGRVSEAALKLDDKSIKNKDRKVIIDTPRGRWSSCPTTR
jgi:hypothetical protein